MTPRATCVSEQALGLGTDLSFIFCEPIENAPLGNFLGQKVCDREKSANTVQTTIESRKVTDDWFSGNIQPLVRFTVHSSNTAVCGSINPASEIGNACL